MKKIDITPMFVMICVVILVAAYGLAVCINEIKESRIKAAENKKLIQEIQKIVPYSPDNNRNQENNSAFAQRGRTNQQNNRTNNPITANVNTRTDTTRENSGQQTNTNSSSFMELTRQALDRYQNMSDEDKADVLENISTLNRNPGLRRQSTTNNQDAPVTQETEEESNN